MERVEIITKAEDGDLLMLTPQMLETVVGNVSFPKVAFAYISEAHFVSELCSFSPVYYRITKVRLVIMQYQHLFTHNKIGTAMQEI